MVDIERFFCFLDFVLSLILFRIWWGYKNSAPIIADLCRVFCVKDFYPKKDELINAIYQSSNNRTNKGNVENY